MNKITSINGTFMASLNELNEHTENESIHVTEDERTAWNAKVDVSALSTKTDASVFDAHKNDAVAHITGKERETWNGKQDKLMDETGSMTLDGGLSVAGTITAPGGVRVPLPSTYQEAMSYEALLEQQAVKDWGCMTYYLETMVPSWVTAMIRHQQLMASGNPATPNTSIKEGVLNNGLCDHVVTITPASGISLTGRSTAPWVFANYMGCYRNKGYATTTAWRFAGSDQVSIMLGSTSHGYGVATSPSAPCYTHPIHWADYNVSGADYRYPLGNAVNNPGIREQGPAWQVTTYPKGYLGSSTSCLIRGTNYGMEVGASDYVWALVPSILYLAVAMTPRHADDNNYVVNGWRLYVDGLHVMRMTSAWLGSGATASVTTKVKAHDVHSTRQVGLRMGGMRIDINSSMGINDAAPIMERVVMRNAVVKPVPEVTASALEVAAAGGEVVLTVSSTLAEAVYMVNDTMCGHDPAAVWCSQSSEEVPSEGGQITLTLAPNTTGEPRQVWVFAGHHYAQAAVIKINQLA